MTKFSCRVCGQEEQKARHTAKENMFGIDVFFDYDECMACNSIQISEIIESYELSKYYPDNYYSFSNDSDLNRLKSNSIKSMVKRWALVNRDRAAIGHNVPFGIIVNRIKPATILNIVRTTGVRPDQSIIDVGCGAGVLLDRLAKVGFTNLLGVDPFINTDMRTKSMVPIKKLSIEEAPGHFDLVMFNHSFEHVPSPRDALLAAYSKLSPEGLCLIRIPTPSSDAWKTYGVHWAHFDAPRHFTLISRSGMETLADQCGFSVANVVDDSLGWSLASSELHRRGIPLSEHNIASAFSSAEIAAFERRAAAANAAGRGDTAAFILKKK